MSKLFKNKIVGLLAVSIVTVFISNLLASLSFVSKWNLSLGNSLYTRNEASQEIVIVGVDDRSRQGLVAGINNLSNISRSDYAKVLKIVAKSAPKVMAIDFVLDKPEREIAGGLLNNAILKLIAADTETQKQQIALGFLEQFTDEKQYPGDRDYSEALNSFNQISLAAIKDINEINEKGEYIYSYKSNTGFPILHFDPTGNRAAMIAVSPDDDGRIRQLPLLFKNSDNGNYIESFSLKTVRKYLQKNKENNSKMEDTGQLNSDGSIFTAFINNLQIPTEKGRMLINYFGQPNSYKTVSFADVYDGKIDPSVFKDKIVLLGPTATALQDLHPTPINSEIKMPGVEIQANAIQTILEQKFLVNQSTVSRLVMGLAIALLAATILAYMNLWLGIFAALVIGVSFTGFAHLMYYQGTILNMVQPYLTLLIIIISMTVYRYFAELKEKYHLRGVFNHYVSPKVIAEVMEHPEKLKLGGESREVTVFFSDIAEFTKLSECLTPHCLVSLINEYLDTMTKVILQNKGTLDKFEGDAIMAFFGAPLDDPHHAFNACNAALQCRQTLYLLHKKWEEQAPNNCPKKPPIEFRIGIASGPAIVGNMGSSERFDYTAMGDTVNLGARLESVNKAYGCRIIVSETVYAQVKEYFDFRELDVIRVKGKDHPVRIFQLLGYKNQLSPRMQNVVAAFHEGLELYREAKFSEAEAEFNKALTYMPDDGPSMTFLKRCQILKQRPPQNWDGIFVMQTK